MLPVFLPGVIKLNSKVDKYIRCTLKNSIDTASSIIMIVLLIFLVIIASVFCAVEIYSETITVVQLGSDVVNYTLNHRPELMDMFPEGMQDSMDNVLENAYQYGRDGIETYVDEFLKDADRQQREKLKMQVLSIWDRMIQYWMDRQKGTTSGPSVPSTAITDSIGEIVSNEGESLIVFEHRFLFRIFFWFSLLRLHLLLNHLLDCKVLTKWNFTLSFS